MAVSMEPAGPGEVVEVPHPPQGRRGTQHVAPEPVRRPWCLEVHSTVWQDGWGLILSTCETLSGDSQRH